VSGPFFLSIREGASFTPGMEIVSVVRYGGRTFTFNRVSSTNLRAIPGNSAQGAV